MPCVDSLADTGYTRIEPGVCQRVRSGQTRYPVNEVTLESNGCDAYLRISNLSTLMNGPPGSESREAVFNRTKLSP